MSLGNFSIRRFLASQQALLVHFSCLTSNRGLQFPNDLQNAMSLRNTTLSFSTILVSDQGPVIGTYDHPVANASGNAYGSIGIVVDISDDDSVVAVSSGDAGFNEHGSLGKPPTQQNCIDSIAKRKLVNEWNVKNYRVVGLFVFEPSFAPAVGLITGFGDPFTERGERLVRIEEVIRTFPCQRIFSSDGRTFVEYHGLGEQTTPVTYTDIMR